MKPLAKLKDLAGRAGKWLARTSAPAPAQATRTVESDRFDAMEWREVRDQAGALREMEDDLGERHDYAGDLLADVWTAAYKAAPVLRERTELAPSRAVNHQVLSSLTGTPEWAELRAHTAGDAYAAAMAVISSRERLSELLSTAEDAQTAAQEAERAQAEADQAAQEVARALQEAAENAGEDGDVDEASAAAVDAAIEAAEQAEAAADQAAAEAAQALAAAAPAMRGQLRAAAAEAAEQLEDEAALLAAWGMGPGELQRMDFTARRRLAERLAGNRLGRFADLIGRFRTMACGERARRMAGGTGELVGITLGDDITRLIPSEAAMLGVPALRAVFAAKLAEAQLMVYDTRGEEHAGKGTIIACIDCSASMEAGVGGRREPTREAWAKACALALLDQARNSRPRRDFAAILFSSSHQTALFHFPADRPVAIADVLEMGEHFFDGGTSFTAPLNEATDLLEAAYTRDGTQKGDIVFITDGDAPVSEAWLENWQARKHQLGFRVFGVAIATQVSPQLEAVSDAVYTIGDLTDPGTTRELFHLV